MKYDFILPVASVCIPTCKQLLCQLKIKRTIFCTFTEKNKASTEFVPVLILLRRPFVF